MHTYTQQIPDFPAYDVIVVGSAGSTAAIATGRAGAKVLLLQHLQLLGTPRIQALQLLTNCGELLLPIRQPGNL